MGSLAPFEWGREGHFSSRTINDPDPDIPILKQAKAEYAKLQ